MSRMSQWDLKRLATLDRQQLRTERAALLGHIDSIERNASTNYEDKNYIGDLWNINNQIVDLLHNLRPTLRFDPIEKLPPELFRTIIKTSVHDPYYPSSGSISDSRSMSTASLILTLVSRRWRDFILGIPELWTQIFISNRIPDMEVKETLFLELSEMLPIHLVLGVNCKTGLDGTISPLLLKYKDRIKSIQIHWSLSGTVEGWHHSISKVLDQLLPLPNLTRFDPMMGEESILSIILDRCRTLHELQRLVLTRDMFSRDSIRHLRTVWIQGDPIMCDMIHQSMPMLNRVSFTPPNRLDTHEQVPASHHSPPRIDTYPLRWKLLCCYHLSPSIPHMMHRLVNLTSLYIGLSFPQLEGFLTHLHYLMSLDDLYLHLITTEDLLEPISTTKIHANLKVRSLVFDTEWWNPKIDTKDIDVFPTMQQALMKAVPAIEELRLRPRPFLETPWFYDWSTVTTLREMDIVSLKQDESKEKYELPPSLHEVRLEASQTQGHRFSSTSTKKLVIRPTIELEVYPRASIDSDCWPELCSLVTYGPCWDPKIGPKFHRLEEIHLKVMGALMGHESYTSRILDSTQLCLHLATEPTALPSLKILTLDSPPHWDILLLMLKRRNLVIGEKFCPLTTLSIPQGYPRELETAIQALIDGKNPEWPSLRDISLHGVLELVEDSSVTGCQRCLHCFESCPTRPIPGIQATIRSEFPSYPGSDVEILSTWLDRNAYFMERVQDCDWRYVDCKNLPTGLVTFA
ncbi:hypothetical protein CPB86DRAFT_870976 [Serendipita vermifera]|nr:hypothetical protein CPB86DRAFT_870976 [Serendipita vermifera]